MRCRFITVAIPILTTLSTLSALPPGGPQTSEDTSAAGTSFRIQDYIPGEFESRLRYIDLGLGAGGGSNSPGGYLYARGLPNIRNIWPSYLASWLSGDARIPISGTGRLAYYWSGHHETPALVTNANYWLTGNAGSSITTYPNNELDMNLSGYAESKEGVSRGSNLSAAAGFSWDRWKYSHRLWFYRFHPRISLNGYRNNSSEDIVTTRASYDILNNLSQTNLYTVDREISRVGTNIRGEGSLDLGIGRGRVYDGTTTWHAMEILETVAALSGQTPEDLDRADYEALAAVLYELGVRKYPWQEGSRLFDYERTERVVARIEETLGTEAISPKAVAVIHDILRYYPLYRRRFGRRWYLLAGGGLMHYLSNSSQDRLDQTMSTWYDADTTIQQTYRYDVVEDYSSTREDFLYTLALGHEVYRPIAKRWQLDYSTGIELHNREDIDYYRHMRTSIIQRVLDDSIHVIDLEYADTTDYRTQQLAVSFKSEVNLLKIRSSRTFWELTGNAMLQGVREYPRPYQPDPNHPSNQTSTKWTAILQSDLSLNHSLAWRLYLVARVGFMFAYGNIAYSRTDWANDSSFGGDLYADVSVSRYF